MTMEEVELGYLLQDNVVCNLARVLSPLWNIQLFQKCATYVYFDCQAVPISRWAHLSVVYDICGL